jgi:TetR/AcrR family transcriptional regulator, repressor for uid operon
MDQANLITRPEAEAVSNRRARILDAAERCFVRTGFHRTTMQHVAAEAGMSAGNLYRYFASKDAIVAALSERDRAEMAADFAAIEDAEDFVQSFRRLGEKHFSEEPRERSVLCLEIWAEATRNPALASLTEEFDREMIRRMSGLLARAQERGALPPNVDPRGAALMVATLANGLFVRRAVAPSFQAEEEIARVMYVIGAILRGAIELPIPPECAP